MSESTMDIDAARELWYRMCEAGPEAMGPGFDFRAVIAARNEMGPPAGATAPDFDLPLSGGDGRRVQLSGLRGRPVALIFGSYT